MKTFEFLSSLRSASFFPDVFNENTIVTASGAFANATSRQYFGRPWSSEAVIIYKLPST